LTMTYRIESNCTGCGMCIEACPRDCITDEVVPVRIDSNECVDCGVCEQECLYDSITPPMLTSREA